MTGSLNSGERARERARQVALDGLILRGLVGSTVHGLSNPGIDDRDEMGVCIEPPEYVIGLRGFEHYVSRTQTEGVPSGRTISTSRSTAYASSAACAEGQPDGAVARPVRGPPVLRPAPTERPPPRADGRASDVDPAGGPDGHAAAAAAERSHQWTEVNGTESRRDWVGWVRRDNAAWAGREVCPACGNDRWDAVPGP